MSTLLNLTIQYASTHGCPARAQLRRWVKGALAVHGEAVAATLLLRFVDAAEGRMLNREYRRKDYATNVLTFAYAAPPPAPGKAGAARRRKTTAVTELQADIIVCAPVVEREAVEQGKSLHAHYAHLVVHGVLHACGLEHDNDDEAEHMERLERVALRRFRIADPYLSPAPPAR